MTASASENVAILYGALYCYLLKEKRSKLSCLPDTHTTFILIKHLFKCIYLFHCKSAVNFYSAILFFLICIEIICCCKKKSDGGSTLSSPSWSPGVHCDGLCLKTKPRESDALAILLTCFLCHAVFLCL